MNTNYGVAIGYQAATNQVGGNGVYIGFSNAASGANINNEYVIGNNLTGKGTGTCLLGGSAGAYNEANSPNFAVVSDAN